MDGFTWVDGAVAGVIGLSALLAWVRGFTREAMDILGWIAAAVVAYYLAPTVEPWLREIPVLGKFLGESCELAVLAAFALTFAAALVLISLFSPLLSSAVLAVPGIGLLDRGLGLVFGVLRGAILVAIVFLIYDRIMPADQTVAAIENSRSAAVFASLKDRIARSLPQETPAWLADAYDSLTRSCSGSASPTVNMPKKQG